MLMRWCLFLDGICSIFDMSNLCSMTEKLEVEPHTRCLTFKKNTAYSTCHWTMCSALKLCLPSMILWAMEMLGGWFFQFRQVLEVVAIHDYDTVSWDTIFKIISGAFLALFETCFMDLCDISRRAHFVNWMPSPTRWCPSSETLSWCK
jgi:hypothetical protein